jgi:hypothetical protein
MDAVATLPQAHDAPPVHQTPHDAPPVHQTLDLAHHVGAHPGVGNNGRERIHWSKDVWDRIDKAVHAEMMRTRVAQKFLPIRPVFPRTTSVPTDSIGGPNQANPTFTVDEGATTRLNESGELLGAGEGWAEILLAGGRFAQGLEQAGVRCRCGQHVVDQRRQIGQRVRRGEPCGKRRGGRRQGHRSDRRRRVGRRVGPVPEPRQVDLLRRRAMPQHCLAEHAARRQCDRRLRRDKP